jgi:hypothetical protein
LRTAKIRLIRPSSNAKLTTVSTVSLMMMRAPGAPLRTTGLDYGSRGDPCEPAEQVDDLLCAVDRLPHRGY